MLSNIIKDSNKPITDGKYLDCMLKWLSLKIPLFYNTN